jgi:transcriptional regulator with XRE-family HTH domain
MEVEKTSYPLGEFLSNVRRSKGLGIRELCRLSERMTNRGVTPLSSGYYSQIETGVGLNPERITMDILWSIGVTLGVDPIKLFVLSRSRIPQIYADRTERDKLFEIK